MTTEVSAVRLLAAREALVDRIRQYQDGVRSGAIAYHPVTWAARGLPAMFPGFGRRVDRNKVIGSLGTVIYPSLYGSPEESSANAAFRSVAWLALHADDWPVRITVDPDEQLSASFRLPRDVAVTLQPGCTLALRHDSRIVTAGSLARGMTQGLINMQGKRSKSYAVTEGLLEDAKFTAPLPVPAAWQWTTQEKMTMSLYALDTLARGVPILDISDDISQVLPASFTTGTRAHVSAMQSTLHALGWLHPFAGPGTADFKRDLMLVAEGSRLYWYGHRAAVDSPRG